ncbi:carboxypeptidase regulatory-like domain-containing protein [Paenibacillus sp. GYB003]|uniref:carboxypeptidase regulatory-like domain-containing protein n=1 Tax=Paenibacillus sp. GYB003 TaxID=2994392 RepID=UPI002F96A0F4
MNENDRKSRLYGIPESVRPRPREAKPERLELFLREGGAQGASGRAKAIQSAMERLFDDPQAAAAFGRDPKTFLREAGLAEADIAWDRIEIKLAQALGDEQLKRLAEVGDARAFVDRLQETGVLPPSMNVALGQAESMGFTPVFAVAVLVVAAVWSMVGVGATVVAAIQALVAVSHAVYLYIWVTGPGSDNPDESNDAASHVPRMPNLNTPHVARLLNKYLNAELLQKLAERLHDKGFGAEVTGELVKRAILAAWKKATSGETSDPDREKVYMDIIQALGDKQLIEQLPELAGASRYAMLAAGFAGVAFDLMVKLHEPVRFVSIDFNPRDLLAYQKVLIIPTGGLYGLDKSGTFKDRLGEYIRLGGTCICMSQQHGYDFGALPGGVEGYGWAEDQSCHAHSVVITAPHPVFAGQDGDAMDVAVDGFFTAWPDNAQVLLRRRINGQPAMLTYRYGEGRVIVTSAYADWGIGFNQLTRDERLLMRDTFAWARLAGSDVPEYDPDNKPFRIRLSLTNRSTKEVASVKLHAVDPDKHVFTDRYVLNAAIAPGETKELAFEAGDIDALGYWSFDATLLDAAGEVADHQYDAATILVNNFDDTLDGVGYKAEAISFSAVSDQEHLLEGETARVRLLIWNRSPYARTLTVATRLGTQRPMTQTVTVEAGKERELPFAYDALEKGGYRFWAFLSDENGKSLGSTNKGINVHIPQAQAELTIDKKQVRPGEAIDIRVRYANATGAVFPADVIVTVSDPGGATLFDERIALELRPSVPGEQQFRFVLPMSVRYGNCKVSCTVETNGQKIGYHEQYFVPLLEGKLAGRVLDAVSGLPVADAKVRLDGGPETAADAGTGSFEFTADAGGHWIGATAPGYRDVRVYTVAAPERTATVEHVYLTPVSGSLKGIVMDMMTNEPIPDAIVSVDGKQPLPLDGQGFFETAHALGEARLSVKAPGYSGEQNAALQIYAGRTTQVTPVFLSPVYGRVEGAVFCSSSGLPVGGAQVSIRNGPSAASSEEGTFSLEVPAGAAQLTVRAEGYEDAAVTVFAPAGRAVRVERVYMRKTTGEAAGVVRDSVTGEPIAGAKVSAGGAAKAETAADGRFRLSLAPGKHYIAAEAPGYASVRAAIVVPAGIQLDDIDLHLVPATGKLSGVVVGWDDKPVQGAQLTVAGEVKPATGEDGAFEVEAATGRTGVAIKAPGYARASLDADVYPGRTTGLGRIRLTAERGRIAGRAVEAITGKPIAGCLIKAGSGEEARTGEDGSFELELAVGSGTLRAEAEGYADARNMQADIHPGRTVRLGDIALPRRTTVIEGIVADAGGSGVKDIRISADGANPAPETTTGENGAWRLEVPAGTRTVYFKGAGLDRTVRIDAYPARTARLDLTLAGGESGRIGGIVSAVVSGSPAVGAVVGFGDRRLARGALRQTGSVYVDDKPPFFATQAVTGDAGWTDYRFSFQASARSQNAWGAVFRYKDAQNCYRLFWLGNRDSGGPVRRLERIENGRVTTLAEDYVHFGYDQWADIRIEAVGGELAVYAYGSELFRVRDDAFAGGKAGFYCWKSDLLVRDIRVERPDGEPLFVESFTNGLAAWTVEDAPGVRAPSAWEAVEPTEIRLGDDGSFVYDSLPANTYHLYAAGERIRTGSDSGALLSVQVKAGDSWRVGAYVAPAEAELEARLLDAVTLKPLEGAAVWTAGGESAPARTDAEGCVRLPVRAPSLFDAVAGEAVYMAKPGYAAGGAKTVQMRLPVRRAGGEAPVLYVGPAKSAVSGTVANAANGEPLSGLRVHWGEPDYAFGAVSLVRSRWHGDPLAGLLHGPELVCAAGVWADAAVSAEMKASRPGGLGLVLRRSGSLRYYRAVVVQEREAEPYPIVNGVLDGDDVAFTRQYGSTAEAFAGRLLPDGTMSGTWRRSGDRTVRFTARRRFPGGSDRISGEWALYDGRSWLKLELETADRADRFAGSSTATEYGGETARIERWENGRLKVLAETPVRLQSMDKWTRIRFAAFGATLLLEAGGATLCEATDAEPLPEGRAAVQLVGGQGNLLRHIRVEQRSGELLSGCEPTAAGADGGDDPVWAGGPKPSGWEAAPGWGAAGGSGYRLDETVAIDGDDLLLATHVRYGRELQYVFPLPPGEYAVELSFCEHEGKAAGERQFDVTLNGEPLDPALDIGALAGPNRLLQRTYRVAAGASGLRLFLLARKGNALINHIRLWPSAANPQRDAPLYAVRCGHDEADSSLFLAAPVFGYEEGEATAASAGAKVRGAADEEQPSLLTARRGRFGYRFRLAPGRYDVELSFAELAAPEQVGANVFDVLAGGKPLWTAIDIARAKGDALLRVRPAVDVGADGELHLRFEPRQGRATVNRIRLFPAGSETPLVDADAGGGSDQPWAGGEPAAKVWDVRPPQGADTDAEGRFELADVPFGSQTLSLRGDKLETLRSRGETAQLPVTVYPSAGLALYARPSFAAVSGTVVSAADGSPIAGAEVWVDGAASLTQTSEAGQFTLRDVPVGERELHVRAPGFRAYDKNGYVMTAWLVHGQQAQHRLYATPAYATVEGVLRDAVNGNPLDGARVWLPHYKRTIVSGADGRFVVDDFPAERDVSVHAASEGYRLPNGDEIAAFPASPGRTVAFEAFLKPVYGIWRGKVLDHVTEQPLAGALVYVDAGEISTTTDRLGQFQLRVPEGNHRLYVELVGYISEQGHNPSVTAAVTPGKTVDFTLYLKAISGAVEGQVLDSVTMLPIPGALVYADEGFANTVTDEEGRYRLSQSNEEHRIYVKSVDYASDREDGWMAQTPVSPDRSVKLNHMLRPTLQLVSFEMVRLPEKVELVAGRQQTVSCRVRNSGKREGGATVRLVIPGFVEQSNTEWLAPGEESDVGFTFTMPDDALTAAHQELFFDLKGESRHKLNASIRGAEVFVEASLDKRLYAPGDTAVLKLTVENRSGGSYPVYTRAQLGDATFVSAVRTLTDTLEAVHEIPVDAGANKLFFGVYLETGRSLFLDAYYVPRQDQLAALSADKQAYEPGETVTVRLALTESGQSLFAGAESVDAEASLLLGENRAVVIPPSRRSIAPSETAAFDFPLPVHLKQGTYVALWTLSAGDKSAELTFPIDVRGYKARFLEFLTDRSEYLHTDRIAVRGELERSHAVRCLLELTLMDPDNEKLSVVRHEIEAAAGRTAFELELPLQTGKAGHHTILYTLYAAPDGVEPILLSASVQGFDVAGPVLLALNTDSRLYRPGQPVRVTVTARGSGTVPLRLAWDSGETALDTMIVLDGLKTMEFTVTAPAQAAALEAVLPGETVSRLAAYARVRA